MYAHYYDAKVGRWISEDPIGFTAGDYNLSRYVGNSVTNFVDPSGTSNQSVAQYVLRLWAPVGVGIGKLQESFARFTTSATAYADVVLKNPCDTKSIQAANRLLQQASRGVSGAVNNLNALLDLFKKDITGVADRSKQAIQLVGSANKAASDALAQSNIASKLADIFTRYPANSTRCVDAAKAAGKAFEQIGTKADVVKLTTATRYVAFDNEGNVLTSNGVHYVTIVGNKVYDALAPLGVTIPEYLERWKTIFGQVPSGLPK